MVLHQHTEISDNGMVKDKIICNSLVVGIRDHSLSEYLQMDLDLTLELNIHHVDNVLVSQNMIAAFMLSFRRFKTQDKYKFSCFRIIFLGHIIDANGTYAYLLILTKQKQFKK